MPPKHFSNDELAVMDKMQRAGDGALNILKAVNTARRRQGAEPTSNTAVYRYLAGETYGRNAGDDRGRPSKIGDKAMRVYDAARKRLQKDSDNEWSVTWEDVAEEGCEFANAFFGFYSSKNVGE